MYGQIPYAFPNAMMQASPSLLGGAGGTANIGNAAISGKTGIAGLLSKLNWSSILSNTQKTLNVVNQAIPLYYQAKPVFKNIRALGKIGREFKKMNTNNIVNSNVNSSVNNNLDILNKNDVNNKKNNTSSDVPIPTFFL